MALGYAQKGPKLRRRITYSFPEWRRPQTYFVFGSNLAGRHGAGAALHAREVHRAVPGIGMGVQGDSVAIPTKDGRLRSLSLWDVLRYVEEFCRMTQEVQVSQPETWFFVTAIGTGLAGNPHQDIAPMFKTAAPNCIMPRDWEPWLPGFGYHDGEADCPCRQ